jgi:dephospho-CoA kinase
VSGQVTPPPVGGPAPAASGRPFQVGLTGSVASGKSTVARTWEGAGVPVVSADVLAREVVAPGSPGLAEVVAELGPDILAPEGGLDRAALRSLVFREPEARRRLEAITHPRIAALRRDWIEARTREGHPLVVSEIPLLFEAGLEDSVDRVVVVDAPLEERIRRMVEERGLDPEEAMAMAEAQMDPAGKRARAHHLLRNEGTLESLESAALDLLGVLREAASAHAGRRSGGGEP